jgi:hypothetical protein
LNLLLSELLRSPSVTSDERLKLAAEMSALASKFLTLGAECSQVELAMIFPQARQEERDAFIDAHNALAEDAAGTLSRNLARLALVVGMPKSERLKLICGDGSSADLISRLQAVKEELHRNRRSNDLLSLVRRRLESLCEDREAYRS